MDSTERIIGALQEAKDHVIKRLDAQDGRFDRLELKLEDKLRPLESFRVRALSISAFVAALISIGIEYFRK